MVENTNTSVRFDSTTIRHIYLKLAVIGILQMEGTSEVKHFNIYDIPVLE